ncbi:MAG: hypothetical protein AAGI01_15735, partial [Myxococcota bacterium]
GAVGTLAIDTGEDVPDTTEVLLTNVHPEAVATVELIAGESTFASSCQTSASRTVCSTAPAGSCPSATLVRSGTVTVNDTERALLPAQALLRVPLRPCARTIVRVDIPEASRLEPLRFLVIGKARGVRDLDDALLVAHTDGPDVDFILLPGDALDDVTLPLEQFYDELLELSTPVLLVQGVEEFNAIATSSGPRATELARVFGAQEFIVTVKDVQLVSYFSLFDQLGRDEPFRRLKAYLNTALTQNNRFVSELDATSSPADIPTARRIERLNELRALNPGGPTPRYFPILAVSYVPPFDSDPARNQGMLSQQQAARTMSLLASNGVDSLFTGRVDDNSSTLTARPITHITSISDPRAPAFLDVTLTFEEDTELATQPDTLDARRVGSRFMVVRRREAPP